METYDLIEDLKTYINTYTSIKIEDAYQGTDPEPNTYRIYLSGVSEDEQIVSLEETKARNVSIQVYAYASQSQAENKTAIEKTYELVDKIAKLFAFSSVNTYNKNVISAKVRNIAPALSVDNTNTMFASSVRIELKVTTPYVKL